MTQITTDKGRAAPRALDSVALVLPKTVRLERVSERRERSIQEAIRDQRRDPRDRLGLAGECAVSSVLAQLTLLAPQRVLCWDTAAQRNNSLELDAVSHAAATFLEIKWTIDPERMFASCTRQLRRASEIYQAGWGVAPRGIGIIVDCAALVDKPHYPTPITVSELVRRIETGTEAVSLSVLPYESLSDYIRCSGYAGILSAHSVRKALGSSTVKCSSPRNLLPQIDSL